MTARDLSTLEGSIDWLEELLQGAARSIGKVDFTFRDNCARNYAQLIATQAANLPKPATVNLRIAPACILWHGIPAQTDQPGLALFHAWLAAARATVRPAA